MINKALVPPNILRGVSPTTSGFDTTPTDLDHATDGDVTTATGEGSKVLGGAGAVGNFTFDLGSIKRILPYVKIGLKTTANTIAIAVAGSLDGNTYTYPSFAYSTTSSNEVVREILTYPLSCRYLQIQFLIVGGAATGTGKLYEVSAYELGV